MRNRGPLVSLAACRLTEKEPGDGVVRLALDDVRDRRRRIAGLSGIDQRPCEVHARFDVIGHLLDNARQLRGGVGIAARLEVREPQIEAESGLVGRQGDGPRKLFEPFGPLVLQRVGDAEKVVCVCPCRVDAHGCPQPLDRLFLASRSRVHLPEQQVHLGVVAGHRQRACEIRLRVRWA